MAHFFDESQIYDKLLNLRVTQTELRNRGFPEPDPGNLNLRRLPESLRGKKLRTTFAPSYRCKRCSKDFKVDKQGIQLDGFCQFHPHERGIYQPYWACCMDWDWLAKGCTQVDHHVHDGELLLKNYQGFVETQPRPEWDLNKHGVYALNCEMDYTAYGLELVRVVVHDFKGLPVYDTLVNPGTRILGGLTNDYSEFHDQLKEYDVHEEEITLADVQRHLLRLFSSKTVIVGHNLVHDMKALKIFHKNYVDTTDLWKHGTGTRHLHSLVEQKLGHERPQIYEIKEDTRWALRLVYKKAGITCKLANYNF